MTEAWAWERAEKELFRSITRITAASKQLAAADNVPVQKSDEAHVGPLASDGNVKTATPMKASAKPFYLGSELAKVRLVIFNDYECPYCQRIERDVRALLKQHPDLISVTYKHFPLCVDCNSDRKTNTHPNACRAASAVEAAGALKGQAGYWRMHEWMFDHKGKFTLDELTEALPALGYDDPAAFLAVMQDSETSRKILLDVVEAGSLKIDATPAIFVNGEQLNGFEAENALVRAVMAAAGEVADRGQKTGP